MNSIKGTSLNIKENSKGSLQFTSDTNYKCVSSSYDIRTNSNYNLNSTKNIKLNSDNGNIKLNVSNGELRLTSNDNLSNAVILEATHIDGGILQTAGTKGININTNNGDINLLSKGSNINIGISEVNTLTQKQTQNIDIACVDTYNINSGDMYFVSSDIISFISQTGDIQFKSNINSNPIIQFSNDNLLVNQNTSSLDYQLDVAITNESNDNLGYNGIFVNSKLSNVAADLTLKSSNTINNIDKTNCILSMGTFGGNNNNAILKSYTAYQINNVIIRIDGDSYNSNSLNLNNGKDFIYSDIGKNIYWESTGRLDKIISLSSKITNINDSSNVTITGTYNGSTSRVYLLEIDSITSPNNTFRWSIDGGNTYEDQFVPIISTTNPITLNNGLSAKFEKKYGFLYNQQFIFQTKITAIVENNTNIDIPETLNILQPYHSYINTSTPSDIVIKTNDKEKMRITADGSISINSNLPEATLNVNSNFNKIINVNQKISGYQINPSISYLECGGYILVWNSQDVEGNIYNFDVFAQRYMADGSRNGNNFKVNNTDNGNQSFPSVAGNKLQISNHFIIVWTSFNNNEYTIFCQIYHNNKPISDADIEVVKSTSPIDNVKVAGLYNGKYIIVWAKKDPVKYIYSIYGKIIENNDGNVGDEIIIIKNDDYSKNFPFVIGLPSNDKYNPNGFVVGYMSDLNQDENNLQYGISLSIFNDNLNNISDEINITEIVVGSNIIYSNISDGLVSLSEIKNNNVNTTNGSFIITFYRSYETDTKLYGNGDGVLGVTSGATASITDINHITNKITLSSVSNRFLIGEEIQITRTNTIIIEKIASISFINTTEIIITLNIGSKNIEAYCYDSNITKLSKNFLWKKKINTSPLYNDLDRFTGDDSLFKYKRPISYITIDNQNTALITWSTDSVPSIYYQLINIENGNFIGTEQKLTNEYDGLKQRNQVATYLKSTQGNDYGFIIAWDNQSLDLNDTGIYQQLIGYKHNILNLEDGNSNFIFTHYNQLGIGTKTPESSLHIKSRLNNSTNGNNKIGDKSNPAIIKLQNTSTHVITKKELQSIEFIDGSNNILNKIQSINSLRYDDLFPQPNNLKGFYKFDETEGTQVIDYSTISLYNSTKNNESYINTYGILNNFNIEKCWDSGIINNSLLFDGNDNYVFIENSASNNLNTILENNKKLSISLWIKIPKNIVNNFDTTYDIISNGGDLTKSGTYLINVNNIANNENMVLSSNIITINPENTTVIKNINLSGDVILNDSKWHHIVETVEISNTGETSAMCSIYLYIDGSLNNSITTSGDITSIQHAGDKTYIGSRNGLETFFRGNIDELRFYNSILTITEIKKLYTYGNPNIPPKSSLLLSPNSNTTHNQSLLIDDDGKVNNLSSRPLPYTILSGEIKAFANNNNLIGTGTYFMNELTIGDIIVLKNDSNILEDYTVLNIENNTTLTIHKNSYISTDNTSSINYKTVLRKPSIYSFFNNSDTFVGNIDNYGNLMIGKYKPSTMLEISGESNNDKLIPEITITNRTIENKANGRKTSLNFRGFNAKNNDDSDNYDIYTNLGHIETSHYLDEDDNKATMNFYINDGIDSNGTKEKKLLSITTDGICMGYKSTPLSLIHANTITDTEECSLILESKYKKKSSSSIFDDRSNIYFAGGTIGELNSANLKSKILSSISGSKNTIEDSPKGRLDFNTNNGVDGLEPKLSILDNGYVGIGTDSPTSVLSVNGSMSLPIIKTQLSLTLDHTHYTVLCYCTNSNPVVITLPDTTNTVTGRIYVIKNISTIDNSDLKLKTTEKFNGTNDSETTIESGKTIIVQFYDTHWWFINNI